MRSKKEILVDMHKSRELLGDSGRIDNKIGLLIKVLIDIRDVLQEDTGDPR